MKFDEDRNRTLMIFESEKPTKVTEILPTKTSPDDSAIQEKDYLTKMQNSDYSATRGDSQLINMKEYSGSRMPCYHSDMPTERQISASSNSEISNKSGSDPDIDIEKCVDGVLKLINVLMKYSINGSKASECNLKATHSSQSLEHQLAKIIQAISEKLIDSDLILNDSTQHAEDWLPECIQAISEKLIAWNNETFSKVDLTKALQKKYKADKIDVALSLLTLQKFIIRLPKETSKKPGRKPSQKYRINYRRELKDES